MISWHVNRMWLKSLLPQVGNIKDTKRKKKEGKNKGSQVSIHSK